MHKLRKNSGFGLVAPLIALVTVAVIGGTAFYIYQHRHKASKTVATTQPQTNPAQQTSNSSSPIKPVDPYAGWKSYCDTVYNYCFKYPADWAISGQVQAMKPGESSSATIKNPGSTVVVTYHNPDTHDSQPIDVTVLDVVSSPTNANITVVGDYYATSGVIGKYGVRYSAVDSSLLKTYPLVKGQAARFLNNPMFSDTGAANTSSGMFTASPAVAINSLDELHAWASQADTQTSVLLLESLSRQ